MYACQASVCGVRFIRPGSHSRIPFSAILRGSMLISVTFAILGRGTLIRCTFQLGVY